MKRVLSQPGRVRTHINLHCIRVTPKSPESYELSSVYVCAVVHLPGGGK
jgi:hypothetical protein